MRAQPTIAQIEARLRAAVLDPKLTVRHRTLANDYGRLEAGHRVISVDPFLACLPVYLHELLHLTLAKDLARLGQLEEITVLSAENALEAYVTSSAKRTNWWRRTIEAKLETGEGL